MIRFEFNRRDGYDYGWALFLKVRMEEEKGFAGTRGAEHRTARRRSLPRRADGLHQGVSYEGGEE